MTITDFDKAAMATIHFNGVPEKYRDRRPFYWTKLVGKGKSLDRYSAPSGWYQWTDDGPVYLGESILNDLEEG